MSAVNISSSLSMAYQASSTTPQTKHILLIFMVSAALMATLYCLITACLWNQHLRNSQQTSQTALSPRTAVIPVALMIPAHTYRKKDRGSENEICAVCLGDFEEGEELKTLPECMHSFHVSCIDMWLHSHSSCPICRADALPSPAVILPRTADSGESDADRSLGMLRSFVVQDRSSMLR